jgi:hypothetical protein
MQLLAAIIVLTHALILRRHQDNLFPIAARSGHAMVGHRVVPTFADMAHMQMERCCFIDSRVANLQFANEVLAMGDTFCANHFGLPLVAILVEDWKGRNLLLAWGFLSDRTNDSFKFFLLARP